MVLEHVAHPMHTYLKYEPFSTVGFTSRYSYMGLQGPLKAVHFLPCTAGSAVAVVSSTLFPYSTLYNFKTLFSLSSLAPF